MDTGLTPTAFAPHEDLARLLLPHAADTNDGSHDLVHIHRVFRNAMRIQSQEGGNANVLAAAVLLHDCVAVEKNSPQRAEASRLAADKASGILSGLGWSTDDIHAIAHAILTHSFSANLAPKTLEAKILQDADRLDAIGMIGVARCFYVAGRMGSKLYDPTDPKAEHRALDDRQYAIDHFPAKLLKLSQGFQTETGRMLASERHERLLRFLAEMNDEI
ncbi:HD domain-containing protein [Peteryoungia ipomoeae]|uniref:HD domain-containing protein n=1 Tax=Peteryoungia ipomoeae TaxID=1210932 RepID=A0A4S8P668_9HYPH|nr:HD domain-containing protein [Peteryoungia ipomoeae]THV25730.1 HD domain-containing protein [Peteryoungia ipomoeae]